LLLYSLFFAKERVKNRIPNNYNFELNSRKYLLSKLSVMKKILFGYSFTVISLCGAMAFAQTSGSHEFKREFLKHINSIRQTGCICGTAYMAPVAPLKWNDVLQYAADGHALDMANNNYFSHTSKDGRTMESRIVTAGYIFNGYKSFAVGENIAFGQQSIDEVMDGWFKSPGHCKNLMNPSFKEVGVAENHQYWVQDFGGRESFSSEQQQMIKSGKMKLVQEPATGH
jgi:uncharacterized protein YkwD